MAISTDAGRREDSGLTPGNADEGAGDFGASTTTRRTRVAAFSLCLLLLGGFAYVQARDIGASFSNSYDEGVYLCSARMVNHGFRLFSSVFSSQPPAFEESLALCFRIFGESVAAGRGMVLFFALASLSAIAWIAWRLFGPMSAPFAMVCLGLPVCFFQNARNCTAEMPSLGFALLAMGFVVSSAGKRHLLWLALGGVCSALGILNKLLVVPMLLPLLLLVCASPSSLQSQRWRWTTAKEVGWRPMAFRVLVFGLANLVTGIVLLMRYDLALLYDQVVRFHEASKHAYPLNLKNNFGMLQDIFLANFGIAVPAFAGLVLVWSRNRGAFAWLCLWLVAAGGFVLVHSPLFDRHLMLVLPPLALAGSASLLWIAKNRGKLWRGLFAIYLAALPLVALRSHSVEFELSCVRSWRSLSHAFPADELQAIRLIESETKPQDFIVTDEQMQAFRAGRSIHPNLCDTSLVRIASGYLKGPETIQAAEGARIIVFWTHRLDGVPEFRAWVESHYNRVKESAGKRIYLTKNASLSGAPEAMP